VTKMHTNDFRGSGETPPGCAACHAAGKTPSTNCAVCHADIVTPHNYVTAHARVQPLLALNSTACVACHGSDLKNVLPAGNDITGVIEHNGCSCHAYGEARGKTACEGCHTGTHAAHGFDMKVSGHNTTNYGTVGALSKFDGSQNGVVVKNSANATITQEWPLPTAGVFWSQAKAKTGTETPPATANTTVGWGSVITCQDCHTNLSLATGPQGANQASFGLDPNYPDDWTQAELTSFDPTGMRSILTTTGSSNPYYNKAASAPAGSGYSAGTVPIKAICTKCHKLIAQGQGIPAQTRAGRSQQGFGWSNEVHMEHHADRIDGTGNCVSCHVAIPHGWKRPRLLVYSSDAAPYKAPQPANWSYPAAGSQYLDAINASAAAVKELDLGVTTDTVGHTWDRTTGGVLWGADPIGQPDDTGVPPVQNNCNACTATGATHTSASEGVPAASPTWK